jgi:hypothetical protein
MNRLMLGAWAKAWRSRYRETTDFDCHRVERTQFAGGRCTRSPAPFRGTVSSVIAGNYNSAVVIRAKAEPLLRPFKGRDASVSAAPMLGFRLNF